jgi:hypothetical protein
MALTPEEVERARPFDEGRVAELEARVDAALILKADGSSRSIMVELALDHGDAPNLRELVRRYEAAGWKVNARMWSYASGCEFNIWAAEAPTQDAMDNAEALVIAAYGEEDNHADPT